jgi:hypothetical protein
MVRNNRHILHSMLLLLLLLLLLLVSHMAP